MLTKIQKWGNSQGLRVSREVLAQVHMAVGDTVDIKVDKDIIMIQPARPRRGRKHTLQELVARMPKQYKPYGEVWGAAQGREAW
jgi:antitoxin MazE